MQRHSNVSILYADIVNFTPLSELLPAYQLVATLNQLFSKVQLQLIFLITDIFLILKVLSFIQLSFSLTGLRLSSSVFVSRSSATATTACPGCLSPGPTTP